MIGIQACFVPARKIKFADLFSESGNSITLLVLWKKAAATILKFVYSNTRRQQLNTVRILKILVSYWNKHT